MLNIRSAKKIWHCIFLVREHGVMLRPTLNPGELLDGEINEDRDAGVPDGAARAAMSDADANG